ncbi:MAG: DUF2085 domain-containing protein [Anaerolineales bacterium]|nr:MAG: DUF2085 domain-containing protein [Anaerolineales bacterium]
MEKPTSTTPVEPRRRALPPRWLALSLAVTALVLFLALVPGGVLDKSEGVGAAVCGRIGSHTFVIGARMLPLCARCIGSFVGALVGFFGQAVVLRRRRAAEFPPVHILVLITLFTLAWAGDGVNSFLEFAGYAHLYEPSNPLRLIVGTLNGVTWSALIYPVVNFTLWREPSPERAIRGLRDLGTLLLLEAVFVALVLLGWDWLLYPLSIVSALGVLTMLGGVNTVLVLTVLRRENLATSRAEAIRALLIGFTATMVLIGAIDIVRFLLTDTLSGFPGL